MQVAPLKHPWARDIFKGMQKNNWVAEEISFQKDKEQWEGNELTEQEKTCFFTGISVCIKFRWFIGKFVIRSH